MYMYVCIYIYIYICIIHNIVISLYGDRKHRRAWPVDDAEPWAAVCDDGPEERNALSATPLSRTRHCR